MAGDDLDEFGVESRRQSQAQAGAGRQLHLLADQVIVPSSF